MLLRAMETLGDERVTGDQLRRTLIILEGLESDENAGSLIRFSLPPRLPFNRAQPLYEPEQTGPLLR